MDISVIIPTWNEAGNVASAVRSALQAGAGEVIVVDGGSRDATAQVAHRSGATVLVGATGRAVQQNLGAAHAQGDVLLFLHADNRLAAGCVRQLRQALQNERVLAGAFRQRIEGAGLLYRVLERGNAARARYWGVPYGDQAIFCRRCVFEQLGGFPQVAFMEDLLLMRELRKRSRPVLLPGPVHVSARRWQQRGVICQTLSNWSLIIARQLGISPNRLARFYPRRGGGLPGQDSLPAAQPSQDALAVATPSRDTADAAAAGLSRR